MQGGLIYIGGGSFIPGVPARDLTSAEVAFLGLDMLLRSGLYREPARNELGGNENKLSGPKKNVLVGGNNG